MLFFVEYRVHPAGNLVFYASHTLGVKRPILPPSMVHNILFFSFPLPNANRQKCSLGCQNLEVDVWEEGREEKYRFDVYDWKSVDKLAARQLNDAFKDFWCSIGTRH